MKHQPPRSNQHKGNTDFSDKSQAYLHIHAHALFSSLGRIVRNPFTSLMTILVMAIAIALASGFYLFVVNVQQLTGSLESSNQISIFLKSNVGKRASENLANQMRKNSKVDKVLLISKEKALEEFKVYSGFGEALNILDNNPLPVVIQVLPKNTLNDLQTINEIVTEFEKLPQVDFVQMDMQWVKRLQSIVHIIRRGVWLLAILLGFAVLVITGNTIRLELQNRKDEVLVEKLVGATNSFIQRPFLYTGFWLGLLSGIAAWLIVLIMLIVLQGPIEDLSRQYNSAFDVSYLGFVETLILLTVASSLGMIGAWVVLRCQLQEIKPE